MFLIIILLGSLELSIVKPSPSITFSIIASPLAFVAITLLEVKEFGVLSSVSKLRPPPKPNAAYSSVKFWLTLSKPVLILSPVASLPVVPMFTSLRAIF